MTAKSVIIIGAGIAGLAAGCYAHMNGYRVEIEVTKPLWTLLPRVGEQMVYNVRVRRDG